MVGFGIEQIIYSHSRNNIIVDFFNMTYDPLFLQQKQMCQNPVKHDHVFPCNFTNKILHVANQINHQCARTQLSIQKETLFRYIDHDKSCSNIVGAQTSMHHAFLLLWQLTVCYILQQFIGGSHTNKGNCPFDINICFVEICINS